MTSNRTTLIVGGTRGLGHGIARALRDEGDRVVTVARTAGPATDVAADATDPAVADRLLDRYRPDVLVIAAGAVPPTGTLQSFTWETFSTAWEQDVRIAFTWLGAVLRRPLAPGATVVVLGSAASLFGSPLSGGYAGAKAAVRFITEYARGEADGTGVTFTAILPAIAPGTAVGQAAVHAYAGRRGITEAQFAAELPAALSPEIAGTAIAKLLTGPADRIAAAYLLNGDGLEELSS
ncbi:SDR family oxidoreductase [Actinoplanes sp. M2I2]|uniref:SDR family NAD(P)-dependent oxidoreductase n=1 Tax=Actinoplanes sp. M2I2 TaxID=1734444 RepID=UPI002021EA77|nr:SDR family oxidoreductase [Actinoplanes sp. M2I2]